MAKSVQEIPNHNEPVSLYAESGQLAPAGEWANYLHSLGTPSFIRRDTPQNIDPDDAYSLSRVPREQMLDYISKASQQPFDEQSERSYWETRLTSLDKELEKVDPSNSRLGISLLILRGYVENQLSPQPSDVTASTELEASSPEILSMFGNGMKVIEMTEKTVKLSPVNPRDEQLLTDRATALTRLGECYQEAGMVRVPKPISISSNKKYIEVQRVAGFPLVSIDRKQQTAIHDLPTGVRTRLITQFLRGIDLLNLRGYVFGDYNASSFNFDPQNTTLWISDPGLNEISSGEYYNKVPSEQASSSEVYKMFENNAFISLMEVLGLDMQKIDNLKTLSSSKQLQSVEQMIDIIQS